MRMRIDVVDGWGDGGGRRKGFGIKRLRSFRRGR